MNLQVGFKKIVQLLLLSTPWLHLGSSEGLRQGRLTDLWNAGWDLGVLPFPRRWCRLRHGSWICCQVQGPSYPRLPQAAPKVDEMHLTCQVSPPMVGDHRTRPIVLSGYLRRGSWQSTGMEKNDVGNAVIPRAMGIPKSDRVSNRCKFHRGSTRSEI